MNAFISPNLLLLIPSFYLMAALWLRFRSNQNSWFISEGISVLGLLLSVVVLLLALLAPTDVVSSLVLLNTLTGIVLTMIACIGWIILRFSRRYLDGDARQHTFQYWFFGLMSAITVLVMANHMALFFLAWVAVSVCLHPLLMYYPERPKAVLAAHKKFLLSRLAEALLLLGLILLAVSSQSWLITDSLAYWSTGATELPMTVQLGVLLLALAAIITCAQLPFHGWLLQVMEAPTPISALLHAGIINVGGFLLLRFSDLVSITPAAQWLLLIVGTTTAIIASLTLMTRISVKVMLAWSTCAQMGFMLLEIALGFYTLALLHLVAHSCYKAYSFLNSGEAVNQHVRRACFGSRAPSRLWHWFCSTVLMAMAIAALHVSVGPWSPGTWVLMVVVAISLSVFIAESLRYPLQLGHALIVLAAVGIIALYLLNKYVFTLISVDLFAQATTTVSQATVVITAFMLFLLLLIVLRVRANGLVSRTLYPLVYGGLYLDEWFSSLLLKLWPCKHLPRAPASLTRPFAAMHLRRLP